ncbi:MAG: UrcA family protein [Steroidobacterales bacterium]
MNRFTTIILTSALAAGAQIAHAADPIDDSRRHVTVHYADLNVTSVGGATALYHRVQRAAESVCSEGQIRDFEAAGSFTTCVSNTISSAVTQINQPTLTAYYRSKLGNANVALRQASR